MKLYFEDTEMGYSEIHELLNRMIGPSGVDTWHVGHDDYRGYVEIYNDPPAVDLVLLTWKLWTRKTYG